MENWETCKGERNATVNPGFTVQEFLLHFPLHPFSFSDDLVLPQQDFSAVGFVLQQDIVSFFAKAKAFSGTRNRPKIAIKKYVITCFFISIEQIYNKLFRKKTVLTFGKGFLSDGSFKVNKKKFLKFLIKRVQKLYYLIL
jgi:hypothetical protein